MRIKVMPRFKLAHACELVEKDQIMSARKSGLSPNDKVSLQHYIYTDAHTFVRNSSASVNRKP